MFVSVHTVSQSIQAINEAVDAGDPAQTLAALRNPGAGLYGVTSECAQTYQNDLVKMKDERKAEGEEDLQGGRVCETCSHQQLLFSRIVSCPGDNGSEWVKHWVKGGHNYFFNLNTKEGSWVEPEGFLQNNMQLNKDDIQVGPGRRVQLAVVLGSWLLASCLGSGHSGRIQKAN